MTRWPTTSLTVPCQEKTCLELCDLVKLKHERSAAMQKQEGVLEFGKWRYYSIMPANKNRRDQTERWAGQSTSMLFTYGLSRFCHDLAHMLIHLLHHVYMKVCSYQYRSRAMRKCVLYHMWTTKTQISLHIRADWSAPLLFIASIDNISRFYSRNFKILASFWDCAGRVVYGLVGNSRRHVLSCSGAYET